MRAFACRLKTFEVKNLRFEAAVSATKAKIAVVATKIRLQSLCVDQKMRSFFVCSCDYCSSRPRAADQQILVSIFSQFGARRRRVFGCTRAHARFVRRSRRAPNLIMYARAGSPSIVVVCDACWSAAAANLFVRCLIRARARACCYGRRRRRRRRRRATAASDSDGGSEDDGGNMRFFTVANKQLAAAAAC